MRLLQLKLPLNHIFMMQFKNSFWIQYVLKITVESVIVSIFFLWGLGGIGAWKSIENLKFSMDVFRSSSPPLAAKCFHFPPNLSTHPITWETPQIQQGICLPVDVAHYTLLTDPVQPGLFYNHLRESFIDWFIHPLVQISSKHCQSKTRRARQLKF